MKIITLFGFIVLSVVFSSEGTLAQKDIVTGGKKLPDLEKREVIDKGEIPEANKGVASGKPDSKSKAKKKVVKKAGAAAVGGVAVKKAKNGVAGTIKNESSSD